MNNNNKRESRDRLIMEALIARRLTAEKEMSKITTELESLKRQELVLSEEVKLLDEILGALPAEPVQRPSLEPERVHTILSPPMPVQDESKQTADMPSDADTKKRRKGLKRDELATILNQRFGDKEFSLDQVVDVLLEVEPGDRRKAYHAAWRTIGILEKSKNVEVVSETPSGKGVKKTYKMSAKT